MLVPPSYDDFFLNGVSFASNAYCYEEENEPWNLEDQQLDNIRKVWSKNFWISAGLTVSQVGAYLFSLSIIVSPKWRIVVSLIFFASSIFCMIRMCQASYQEFSWDKRLLSSRELRKPIEKLGKAIKEYTQIVSNYDFKI